MNLFKSIGILTILFSLSLFVMSCGNTQSHDHDDHNHDDATHAEVDHGEGQSYNSAYICPMHCKGGGSEDPGKCPVCGMNYVALTEHSKDGHNH